MRSFPLGIVKWGTRGDFVILVHLPGQTFLQGINYPLSAGKSRKESEAAYPAADELLSNCSSFNVALEEKEPPGLRNEPARNF